MKRLTLSFVLGITLVCCGGDSKSPIGADGGHDAATLSTDGKVGLDGNVSTDGSVAPGCFAVPSCVVGFNQACPIEGIACTKQLDTSTLVTSVCFANGVKMNVSVDLSAGSGGRSKGVVKKANGDICYGLETVPGTEQTLVVYTNAAGQTLFTLTVDAASNATITCPGGLPVAIPKNCEGVPAATTPICPVGTCAP